MYNYDCFKYSGLFINMMTNSNAYKTHQTFSFLSSISKACLQKELIICLIKLWCVPRVPKAPRQLCLRPPPTPTRGVMAPLLDHAPGQVTRVVHVVTSMFPAHSAAPAAASDVVEQGVRVSVVFPLPDPSTANET